MNVDRLRSVQSHFGESAVGRSADRLIQAQQWSCIIACDVHFVGEDLLSPCPSSSLKIDDALHYSRAVCSSPRNHVTLFPVTREDELAFGGPAVQGGLPTLRFLSSRIDIVRRTLKEKRPLYAQRHDKVILLHDNARPHVAKPVKTYLETLKWEVLPHPPYSPDIAPTNFHLFRSMAHGLADRRFHSYEEAQKWIDSWIASKDMSFFRRGIHVLPERWEKVVSSDGQYFK
ncbi:MOS1T transposase, partial [Pseudoatta argentina]